MSREKFLKSAQTKKSLNKSKAVPNMRIEALLEATCKRLRLERKHMKREIHDRNDDSTAQMGEIFQPKKSRLEFVEPLLHHEEDDDSDDVILESDEKFNKDELKLLESTNTIMAPHHGEKDLSKSSLWDDPKQVEDFLKLVNASNNNIVSNSNNNTVEVKKIGLDFEDDFLDTCGDDDPTSTLSSFVANYDVNSFTVEFDNLYKELVQNLVTVETFISQPTCM